MEKKEEETEDDYANRFSEDERITANLRFRSLPARASFLIGVFALVPPKWRGPVLLGLFALLGYFGPKLIEFALSRLEGK